MKNIREVGIVLDIGHRVIEQFKIDLEKKLHKHRKEAYITCPKTCECWEWEAFLSEENKTRERE